MKKRSLLSLLALAGIFLLGCQNYDDQFDQLNKKINDLQTELDEVSDINSKIESLQKDIDALKESINDDGENIENVATLVANIQARLDALNSRLEELQRLAEEDPDVTEEDINNLNTKIEALQEQVAELLSRNAFAQGPLSITNQAELAYAKSLGEFTNVRGSLTVDITDEELRDSITAVNTILGRIVVISGGDLNLTGHASHTLDASQISFIDGNLNVHTKAANLAALTSVSKHLQLTYATDYDFPLLTKTGSITLTDGMGVTLVNFPIVRGVNGSRLSTAGATVGTAIFNDATTVEIGDIEILNFTANDATNVELGYDGTASARTQITATKANASIRAHIGSTGTHSYTLTADDDASVNLSDLETASAHLSITAGSVNLSSLTSVAQLTINEVGTVNLSELTQATDSIVTPDATSFTANKLTRARTIAAVKAETFSAETLVVSDTLTLTKAENVTVGSTSHTLLTAPDLESLTVLLLENGIELTVDGYSKLETLVVTGKAAATPGQGNQNNLVLSDDADKLESVTLGGSLGLVDLSNNDEITEINTAGNIKAIEINNNDALEQITLGHSYVAGDFASTVTVTNNGDLESLNMTTVKRVKTISITGNAKLSSIQVDTGADSAGLAEPVTDLNFTVTGNKLLGAYTAAQAGTETTAYVPAKAVQADLYRFKQLIQAYQNRTGSHTGDIIFNLSYDEVAATPPATGTVSGTLIASLDADTVAQAGPDGTPGGADAQTDNSGGGAGTGINNHNTINELALLAEN